MRARLFFKLRDDTRELLEMFFSSKDNGIPYHLLKHNFTYFSTTLKFTYFYRCLSA